MQLAAKGVVLRDCKIQEDRALTILTDKLGVLTAYAGGANRTRSRLAASTELLSYSDLALFKHRGRYTVDKADSLRIFFDLRGDLVKLSLASYMAELMVDLGPQGEPGDDYLRLLLNALHLLEKGARTKEQIKPLYELRLLTMAGFMPDLVACRGCGAYEADSMYFLPLDGELICGSCQDSTGTEGGSRVPRGVLAAMRHIVYSGFDKLFHFSLSPEGLLLLGYLSEEFLAHQVDKTFPTLEFYHTIVNHEEESFPI